MNPFVEMLFEGTAAGGMKWLTDPAHAEERKSARQRAAVQWADHVLDQPHEFTTPDLELASEIRRTQSGDLADVLDAPTAMVGAEPLGGLARREFSPVLLRQPPPGFRHEQQERALRTDRHSTRSEHAAAVVGGVGILLAAVGGLLWPSAPVLVLGLFLAASALALVVLSGSLLDRSSAILLQIEAQDLPSSPAASPIHAETVAWANTWLRFVDPADLEQFYGEVVRQVDRSAQLVSQCAELEADAHLEEERAGTGWQTPSQRRLLEAVAELELIGVQVAMLARAAQRYHQYHALVGAQEQEQADRAAAQEQLRVLHGVEQVYLDSYREVWQSLVEHGATGGLVPPDRIAAGDVPAEGRSTDLTEMLGPVIANAQRLPPALGDPVRRSAARCTAYGQGIDAGLGRLALLQGPQPAAIAGDIDPSALQRVLQAQNARLAVLEQHGQSK